VKGAVVQEVVAGAPAGKAGVKAGDVVVAVNGKAVEDRGQLTRLVAAIPPGGKAALSLYRDGKKQELTVTVGQRPDEDALARGDGGDGAEAPAADDGSGARLGWKLQALTPEIARQLKFQGEGVVVAEVAPDGAAARAGLQRGDVVVEVNRKAVSKPEEVTSAVSRAKAGEVVLLRVKRGSAAVFVPVRVPEPEAPAKK
jgi:serine protease Do